MSALTTSGRAGMDGSAAPSACASGRCCGERTAGHPVAAQASAILRQCGQFVRSISDETFVAPSPRMMGSTIGQHVRHTLDHFAAAANALDGLDIDYDHRARNTPVETNRAAALAEVARLEAAFAAVDHAGAHSPVTVRVMLSARGDEQRLRSTLAREIAFASHHATHHHAMMASIALEHGAATPPGFGKAPSTLHHESARSA